MENKIENQNKFPEYYFNGFKLVLTAGDINIILVKNGEPIVTLNSSYTVTKELYLRLQEMVGKLESKMKSSLLTIQEVSKIIEKINSEDTTEINE